MKLVAALKRLGLNSKHKGIEDMAKINLRLVVKSKKLVI